MESTFEEDSILDRQISAHKVPNKRILYMLVALTASVLPTYPFQGIAGMEFSSDWPFYLIVPIASAVLLSMAYHSTFVAQHMKLKTIALPDAPRPKKGQKATSDDSKVAELEKSKYEAALGYSLFFCNLVFILLVLFFNFYLFKSFDRRINYTIGMTLASGLVYWLALENTKTVTKKQK
eukprot:NODE_1406_length_882_cov_295.036014_g1161_i0.p1 GENE.NODE_1406_length_882_cov_295.036014_g1161_i0~~NODE_1406_length_882_cov_295.036014_g1161_i0.p1  ORF type:complete len:179 (+),score=55.21 NODE_1406_length_882_cov_295.036014_g1161_i0:70-606(+)